MRHRLKVIVAALCILALAVTPVFAAWGDVSSGAMTATNQTYHNYGNDSENKPIQRIDEFTLDDLYKYKSLGGDDNDTKPTLTLSSSALQKVVKEKLLPQWSPIAASVFRDQANQLVDLYGYSPSGGNMSQAGFDAYFNMSGSGNTTYKDETWSTYSLKSKLEQTTSSHAGDRGWDQLIITGVKQVNSLSGARDMMAQSLRDSEKTNAVSAQEFLNADEAGNTRLEGLDSTDQTIGFANVVTAVNCMGSSANFDYVSFGIVLYDFEPVPVAANNLKYVTGGFTSNHGEKYSQSSEVTNGQQQDILHSAKLGDAVTETTSTELSALASFEMSENMGANIGWSETESSTEMSFWPTEEGLGGESSTSSETTSMGLNWGTAWKMAGSLGAKIGHSESQEVSKAVETTISIPAHAVASIDHTTSTNTYTQTYQQPTVLNYKVAIFAMSGDFYSSAAFGGIGGINTGDYDKQSLVIKFGTKDETTPFYGCAATDDLYSRTVTNKDVRGYDTFGGRTYTTHSTASRFSKNEDIDWYNVANTAQSYYGVNVVNDVATKNFFYETPGSLKVEKDKTSSNVQSIYPLHDLASVKTTNKYYVLYSGNTLDESALSVKGYNKYGVPFYGFDSEWGEWKRCNENGVLVNGGNIQDNDPVTLEVDRLVPKNNFDPDNDTIYLTWKTKPLDEWPHTTENPAQWPKTGDSPQGQDLTASNIAAPIVTIKVVNSGLDNPTIEASGSYIGFYRNTFNLNDVLSCEVISEDDRIIDAQVKWETRQENIGITVNENGDVSFSEPGAYLVRPFVYKNADAQGNTKKVYPNWLAVVATEHDMTHYDAKAATNCIAGNADGWIEHYRCSDCGKYFSDAEGKNVLSQSDVITPALGHSWGDWKVVSEDSEHNRIVEQRVCKNNSNHKETRESSAYTVKFDLNGQSGTAPKDQMFRSDTKASVEVPTSPTATGWTFEGWYDNQQCSGTPYNFAATVNGNLTLYAKWSRVQHAVATVAVESVTGSDGEQTISPATGCYVTINNGGTQIVDPEDSRYEYYYAEPAYDTTVTLNVTKTDDYKLIGIQAVPVNPDNWETGAAIQLTPDFDENITEYKFTTTDADVAVMANFVRAKVNVTYDGNKPENVTVSGLPTTPQSVGYGEKVTLPTTDPTCDNNQYVFGGWCLDKAGNQPFLNGSKVTQDTTLYAKWTKNQTPYTVTYTLMYPEGVDPSSETISYKAAENSEVYNPTSDLYAVVGQDDLAKYDLKKAPNGSCWYKNSTFDDNEAYVFEGSSVTGNLTLYAKVVPREYTVTYYNDSDGKKALGTQSVTYNNAIGAIDDSVEKPAKDSSKFLGWSTRGEAWDIEKAPVTSNLSLYASWENQYTVTFDSNFYGLISAPPAQTVDKGSTASNPGSLAADGYTFGGWFTDQACTKPYDFETQVTANITLYAKWTANPAPTTITPAAVAITTITPAAVAITNASSPLRNNVVVSWGAVNDADGYEVAVGSIITSVNANQTTVNVANTMLKQGKKYSVMVRAWHMNGNVKTYGNWSAEKKVKISKRYMAKTKKKVKAYKKASTGSAVKAKLKKKTTVKVLKVKGKWAKTNKGWIQKKYLKAVKTVNTPTDLASTVLTAAADLTAQSTPSDSASSLTAGQIG